MCRHPSLGNLSRLPPEIRLQIWDHLSWSCNPIRSGATDLAPSTSSKPRLAFLQTSHWVHDEASQQLYKDLVLRFQVSPRHQYRSWLTVESNAGTSWHLQDLDDALSRGFGNLPYEKLKGIHVEIDAPCRRDPGQIVCLWKKCRDLAGLLEQADRALPNLEIHLKDSTAAKWCMDGQPQMSVAVDRVRRYPPRNSVIDRWNDQAYIIDEDFMIALNAFYRLRNCQTAKVYLPEDMVCDGDFAYNMEAILIQKEAFGTWVDADDPWNDKVLQWEQDQMFSDLDIELDILPGTTADMMRLERFSSWYMDGLGSDSKYEREFERIFKTRSNRSINSKQLIKIKDRYAVMRALNPKSFYHMHQSENSQSITRIHYSFFDAEKIQKRVDLGLIEEDRDRDTWHNGCYPMGIPPFDNEAFFRELWRCVGPFRLTRYSDEYGFGDKPEEWAGDEDSWDWYQSLDYTLWDWIENLPGGGGGHCVIPWRPLPRLIPIRLGRES